MKLALSWTQAAASEMTEPELEDACHLAALAGPRLCRFNITTIDCTKNCTLRAQSNWANYMILLEPDRMCSPRKFFLSAAKPAPAAGCAACRRQG